MGTRKQQEEEEVGRNRGFVGEGILCGWEGVMEWRRKYLFAHKKDTHT